MSTAAANTTSINFERPASLELMVYMTIYTMRVEFIGHLKTCMTDIYIHIWCAHGRLYPHAPVAAAAAAAAMAVSGGGPGGLR